MSFFSSFFSNYARAFNTDLWWKYYNKSRKSNGLIHELFVVKYMRIASKNGGYVGRETVIQSKPNLPHGFHGIHISRKATIGQNVTIFQNVTIGTSKNEAPIIGDNVLIGANSVIIGNITIGNNAKIGAGAIVVSSIPDGATAVSPKANIIGNQ